MNSQELETAVRNKLNIIVIILNDSSYGMIKWKQEGIGFESYGLDYKNPDFVKYVESYGGKGWRIDATDELLPTLQNCLSEPAVHLIDVPVDYSLNDETLNKTIRELSSKL